MVIWQCMRPRPDSSRSSPAPVGRRPKMAQSDEARSAALVLAGVSRTVLARQQHITRQGLRARERTPGREGGLSIRAAVGACRRRACPRRLRARWRRFDLGGLRRQRARRGRELPRAPAHRPKGEQHRAEGAVHSPSPSAVEASSSPSSCLLRDRRERRRGSGRGRRRGDRHARRPRRLRGLSRRRGNPHARRHRNRAQGARWRRRGRRRGRRRERRGDHRIDRGGSYRGAQPTMLQPRRTRRGGAQPPRERRSRPQTGWTRSAR